MIERTTISYHCVLYEGKMKCNHLCCKVSCQEENSLEEALPCSQNHKIPVSCEEPCRQTPTEDSRSGLDHIVDQRAGFGGPCFLPGEPAMMLGWCWS